MAISRLVETTWIESYPRTTKITYDCGSECIGHELKKYSYSE